MKPLNLKRFEDINFIMSRKKLRFYIFHGGNFLFSLVHLFSLI